MEVEPPAGVDMLAARVVALFGTTGYIGVWKVAEENVFPEAGPVPADDCGAVECIDCGDEDVMGTIGGMIDVPELTELVWGECSVVPAVPMDVLFINPYGGGAEETIGTLPAIDGLPAKLPVDRSGAGGVTVFAFVAASPGTSENVGRGSSWLPEEPVICGSSPFDGRSSALVAG